jgi:membrane-bound lytic murein transglycosylase D
MRNLHPTAALIALAGAILLAPFQASSQSFLSPGGVSRPISDDVIDRLPPKEPAVVPPSMRPAQLAAGAETGQEASSPAMRALRTAERLFQHGRFLIQEGQREEARRVFDEAVDTLLAIPEGDAGRERIEKRVEELIRRIHRYDMEELGAAQAPQVPMMPSSPLEEILNLSFPAGSGSAVAGRILTGSSQLPLTVNEAVLNYIQYFTGPRGSRILLNGLRRSGRYRQMIFRIFDEEGVPRELIHLAQAESAFQPRAVSRAQAVGMWQFIRGRGREYGLEAGKAHDERMDPEKATRAAARHLKDLYDLTGDWYLAMAAYNCGPACVERAVQRTGYADFWELRARNALPKETMNYVPAILAIAIIAQDPQHYGLPAVEFEDPLEFDTIRLEAETSLALIADAAEVPAGEILDLNPAVKDKIAPAGFEVRVPRGTGAAVLAALNLVPAARRASCRLHRVSPGDTAASIARHYGAAAAQVAAMNDLSSLEEGAFVVVPVPAARNVRAAKLAQSRAAGSRSPRRRTPASSRASAPSSSRVRKTSARR